MEKASERIGDWFRQFVQDLPALAWAKDEHGRYVYVNAAAVEAFGKSEDAVLGHSDAELFSRETADIFTRNDQSALETKRRLQTVEVLEDSTGHPRYSLVTKFPIQDSEGTTFIAGTAIDITEQHTVYSQHELLFQTSEMIRTARDGDALMRDIAKVLGNFMRVDRCLFNEIDLKADRQFVASEYNTEGRSVIGEPRISAYSAETTALMRSGRTVVNHDSKVDDRTASYFESVYRPARKRSYIAVPMVREGQWVASLWCSNADPRNWTKQEIDLVEAIAERTWAAVERLRTETSLRQYSKRNSLLLELGDKTRNVSDPLEIQRIASHLLGEFLDVARVTYTEIEGDEAVQRGGYNKHVQPLPERLKYATYASRLVELWNAGEMVVVHDVDSDARLSESERRSLGVAQIGAFITTTLIKSGKWVAGFSVHSVSPRRWSDFEVDLVRDVGERTWDSVERARSEGIASRAQRTFFELVEQAPFGVYIIDSALTVVMVNHGSQEGAFRNVKPLIGRDLGEALRIIWPPDVADEVLSHFRHTLETGDPFFSKDFINPREDIEKTESYEWELHRIELPDGSLGVVCYYFDSTRLREAEMALRESEERFRNMADHAPVMIWVTDAAGGCTYLSQSWYDFTGQTPEEGLGAGFVNAIHPEQRVAEKEKFHTAVEQQAPFYSEHRLRRADASYAWMICSAHPRVSATGEFLGHIGSVLEITDRKVAEERLRKSRDLSQSVIDSMPSHIAVLDENGEITLVNRSWTTFGNDNGAESDLHSVGPGINYLKVCDDAAEDDPDAKPIRTGIADVLSGKIESYSLEYPCDSPTAQRWFLLTAFRLLGGGAVISHEDITARRTVEERVRSSENQLRLVTDSLPALVSYIGRDGAYKFVNRRYTDWFGEPSENIVGSHMSDVLGRAAVKKLEPYIGKVLAGETVNFETWIDYSVAGRRYVHVAYVPDLGPRDRVEGYYALVSDFTEHRRSQDLLRASEERMKVLTDSFTDYSILSVDLQGTIDTWNPGGVNIFGYSDSEIIGRPIDELFTPEDRQAGVPQQEMKKAAQYGRALDERWHLKKDGSRFFASGVMVPLYINEALTGYAKIATDLTEKRQQAEELQTAYEEMELRVRDRTQQLAAANKSLLEQINERRSVERQQITLLQRIVTTQEDERRRIARDLHDQLGQRLTALRLKLSSLGDLCEGEPELTSRVLRLQQIAGLLDSEVGFLAWQLRPQALDELGLVPALQTFVAEWSRHYDKVAEFHSSGVQDLRLRPEIETQIYRITQEALNNVVKHADAESVSVILERVHNSLVLIVEDKGIGFDPESIAKRPDSLHGLGIAGMKERTSLIGGEMEIESERGSGTTIYLRVPITDVPADGTIS